MLSYSLENTFDLISKSVGSVSSSDLVERCKTLGMFEQAFHFFGFPSKFPEFDKGYLFKFKTDNNIDATLEILEKDNKILQAGAIMTYPRSILFSKVKNHFSKMLRKIEAYYGTGMSMNVEDAEIVNFADTKTVCYLSKGISHNTEYISFKIGDRIFWD